MGELPVSGGPFVGRRVEVAELHHALSVTRMLTLVGPAGIGKTRLAIEALRSLATGDQQVAYVDLAPLRDAAHVGQAFLSAVGVEASGGREPLDAALEALGDRPAFLIVDNCEHLLEESARVCDLVLRCCPGVRVLATSREGPVVTGGSVWSVPPLRLPEPDAAPEEIGSFDAVALFYERARQASPSFAIEPPAAPVVADICRRLDGIPLAIELTAARTDVLGVEQIADRLRTGRPAAAAKISGPARHRTLEAAIAWSYELLHPDEARLLDRLSVFVDRFGPEAAEAVCSGDGIDEARILDLLASLARKSLVSTHSRDGYVTYRLLEAIRDHATRRVAASCGTEELRRRHREHYAELLARIDLQGPDQVRWFELLDAEYENVRAAFADGPPLGGVEGGQAVRTLSYYRYVRYRWTEARRWLSEHLGATEEDPRLRSFMLDAAGRLALAASDHAEAHRLAEMDLELSREHGSWKDQIAAAEALGDALAALGRQEDAEARFEEALALSRENDSGIHIMLSLQHLAQSRNGRGEYREAESLWREARDLAREVGDRYSIATAEKGLGDVARHRGAYATACSHYEETVRWYRELGATDLAGRVLVDLALALIGLGRLEEASERLREALSLLSQADADLFRASALCAMGDIGLVRGRLEESRVQFQEALRIGSNAGDVGATVVALDGLGRLARVEERSDESRAYQREALTAARDAGWQRVHPLIASVAAHERAAGRTRPAAMLWGFLEGDPGGLVGYLAPDLAGEREAWRRTLTDDLEEASREGRALSLEGCIELALSDEEPIMRAAPRDRVFRREGDVWFVSYEGDDCRLKHTKGMRYLDHLLSNPNRELHVLQLIGGLTAPPSGSVAPADASSRDATSSEVLLDDEAKAALRERIQHLTGEIEEAELFSDAERAASAREELDELTRHLAAAVGLGGRDRKPSAAAERARVNVTRAIRTALDRIAEEHPLLGDHLRATVSTGTFCSYTPDPGHPVRWTTSAL